MNKNKFGQRIKELRIERNLYQADIAEMFNVHRTTVTNWETRGKEPDYVTLCKLARYFEVTTDYLLGLVD